MSPAERAGIAGVVLLAGAMVAAAILLIGRRDPPVEPEPEVAAVGTADNSAGEREPEINLEAGGAKTALLRREILRLRREIERRDLIVAELTRRLEEAGLTVEKKQEDPGRVAREFIERLRECGPETAPSEIERLVRELAELEGGVVGPVKDFFARGLDTSFTDTWSYYGGRFTAYPTLRLALLDVLRRVAGGEGAAKIEAQAAMVTLLRNNPHPLEIGLLVVILFDVRELATVEEEILAASRRFLTLPPHPRELSLLPPLMEVLADQDAEAAATDLLAYFSNPDRPANRAAPVLEILARLPDEIAIQALSEAALLPDAVEKNKRAAARLARIEGAKALAATRAVIEKVGPEVRTAIFESIPRPLGEEIANLERTAMRAGIEGVARLDRLEGEAKARLAILSEFLGKEEDKNALAAITKSRRRLLEYEQRAAKLRERLKGK